MLDLSAEVPRCSRPNAFSQVGALLTATLSFVAVFWTAFLLSMAPMAVALGLPARPAVVVPFLAASCAVGFYASFSVARFAARGFPVRANGTRREGVILAVVACVAVVDWWLRAGQPLVLLLAMTVPTTVLVLGATAWTLLWHTRTTGALRRPYVLFLRRFSSFSDRAVLRALLAAVPSGHRTAYLAPVAEAAGNFSPMVVAFSGTRLRHPLASCPLPLQARDVEWEENVEGLIRSAACVVVDPSDASPAVEREIAMVRRLVAPERVLWVKSEDASASPEPVPLGQVVTYRRSWLAALPRILFEALVVAFVVLSLVAATPDASTARWASWAAGALTIALAAPLILHPAVPRSTRHVIAAGLREALGKSARMADEPLVERRDARRAGCVVLTPRASPRGLYLANAARAAGLRPEPIDGVADARSLRDAVRRVSRAQVVVADVSEPDGDVAYLVGIAHALGRAGVLVSTAGGDSMWGERVRSVVPGSQASARELSDVLAERADGRWAGGPVAALLADEVVFGQRLAARRSIGFAIDVALAVAVLLAFLAWLTPRMDPVPLPAFRIIEGSLLLLALYRAGSLMLTGTTAGMALVGLRLVDGDGGPVRPSQALGRSLAMYLAMLPFAASLAALFAPRHQVLEDMLAGTQVVRSRSSGGSR